jgi:3-oxoadipate enol-lactonase
MKHTVALMILLASLGPCVHAEVPEWVTVNHVSLRYQLSGNGPDTVVLLQESGLPLEAWDEILPALQARHRTILRYDLRGFGLSEKIRTPVTMADEVEDLHALLSELKLREPVVLIGGALGGSIALAFAAAHPDNVRAVVVTSPSALLVAREPRPWINPAVDPAGARAAAERTLNVVYPPELRGNVDRWQRYLGMVGANDPDSEMLTEKLINTTAFADVLPRIRCPALLVATAKFVRPIASVRELAQRIPRGRFMVLQTGHLAALQSPERVAPVLTHFLGEVGS